METIVIKYHADIPRIGKFAVGDWIDLRAAKDVYIKKGCFAMIPLGVSMQLPKEHEAIVAPRSSTFKRYGIIMTNGIGIIDNAYCGDNDEWQFPAYCLEPRQMLYDWDGKGAAAEGTEIHAGDRIAQFRIQRVQPAIYFEVVEHLGNEDRGGFGSTGIK